MIDKKNHEGVEKRKIVAYDFNEMRKIAWFKFKDPNEYEQNENIFSF